jgi:hypothetical protein
VNRPSGETLFGTSVDSVAEATIEPRDATVKTRSEVRFKGYSFSLATLDVMSPRHCGELEERLKSSWAVDIHDLLGFFILA